MGKVFENEFIIKLYYFYFFYVKEWIKRYGEKKVLKIKLRDKINYGYILVMIVIYR